MVKSFDMERTDLTVQFLEQLMKWKGSASLMSHDRIMKTLQSTIQKRMEYITSVGGIERMPSIVLKNRCKDISRYSRNWRNFEYLPAYYDSEHHAINLCTDKIRHEVKLEENFVRELIVGTLPPALDLTPDENLARASFRGCSESIKLYTNDRVKVASMTEICTRHLFKVAVDDQAPPGSAPPDERR